MQKLVKDKKKLIINIVITLGVTLLTIYYFLKNGIINDIGKIKEFSVWGILLVVAMVFIYIMLDCYIVYGSIKSVKAKLNFGNAMGAYYFGNLGSAVTPCKSGHFPFIFYYYGKKGVPFDKSLNIVSQNQIIYSTTTIIVYLVFSIICGVNNFTLVVNNFSIQLLYVALVGFAVNFFSLSFVILMSFSARFQNFFINLSAKFLMKLKKIENKENYILEQKQKMESYRTEIKYLCSHLYKALKSMLAYTIFIILIYSTPYAIYLVLCKASFNIENWLLFMSLAQAMAYITNVIPVPGGTGVAEFSFLTVYASVIPSGYISVAVICWRLLTYYLLIVVDFIWFLCAMRNSAKQEIAKEKEA